MRPKSMATVVETFVEGTGTSSMPMPALVMSASVRSGAISDTAPTNVVLPTPNPPATTIFADVVDRRTVSFELLKSTEHPFKQCHGRLSARGLVAAGLVDLDQSGLGQVGHEDPDD